ncbi:polyprenyl diphosphate synthase [Candidatus Pelagibacter sp. HIMB1542]|uniref:polyprenyl diphosphate synthase n=1 Tax=Candidatus Pelagibacter sp. HIMB1542 TaxID=3413346 RepID=UPI003F871D51
MNPLNHVAIIMDGNGRWGLKRYNSRNRGHRAGLDTIEKIVRTSIDHNIKFLTLFAFSTENWKRPKSEINYLFDLLENFLKIKLNQFHKNNIKLKIIGQRKFSKKLNKLLSNSEKVTNRNTGLQLNIALNYGSRIEIINSIKKINKKKLSVTEDNINKNLYTKNIPDPDILIRTGKTRRLSNFLLWQLSYTEIFFSNKLWPDFNERNYTDIIKKYRNIKRNFGEV